MKRLLKEAEAFDLNNVCNQTNEDDCEAFSRIKKIGQFLLNTGMSMLKMTCS